MEYAIELHHAVQIIQEAMVRINARNDGVLNLKSAEVELSTQIEIEGSGEIKVFVVGLTYAIGWSSTNTIALTLIPSESAPGIDKRHVDPVHALVAMVDQIVAAVKLAADTGNSDVKLSHGGSSVTLDLVVTESGELTVGTPDTLDKLFNIAGKGSFSQKVVAKNSIRLNFE